MTIARRLDIISGLAVTLRTDVFNVFNRTNFGPPERDLGNPSPSGESPRLPAIRGCCSFPPV